MENSDSEPALYYIGYTSEHAAALFIFFKHFRKLGSNSCTAPFTNFENVKQIVRF